MTSCTIYVPNMYVTSPLFITRLLLMQAIFARIVYYVVRIPCRSHSECVGIPTSNKCLGKHFVTKRHVLTR